MDSIPSLGTSISAAKKKKKKKKKKEKKKKEKKKRKGKTIEDLIKKVTSE